MGLQWPEKLKNFNNNKFSLHLPSTFVASMMYKATGLVFSCTSTRTCDPSVKVKSTLSVTASTFLHRLVLLSVCFIYHMSRWYSTNWDRNGWPGSGIQMYYGVYSWMEYLAEPTRFLKQFWHLAQDGKSRLLKKKLANLVQPFSYSEHL